MLTFGKKIAKPTFVVYIELVVIDAGIRITRDHNLQRNQITSDYFDYVSSL